MDECYVCEVDNEAQVGVVCLINLEAIINQDILEIICFICGFLLLFKIPVEFHHPAVNIVDFVFLFYFFFCILFLK